MLSDSADRSDAVSCTAKPEPWRRDAEDVHTQIWKDIKRNTHRQYVRIVQSHHRILCNNSNCRRSSSRAASPSLPLRACVTSPAPSLLSVSQIQNLPLSAPARSVCPANPLLLHHLLLLLLLCWPLSHLQTFPSPLLPKHVAVLPSSFSLFFCSLFPCRWANWGCWHHWERKRRLSSLLSILPFRHAPCYADVLVILWVWSMFEVIFCFVVTAIIPQLQPKYHYSNKNP